eukprot:SAG31_NODE_779_length_12158_cov_8.740194_8_plen_52_part_00
MVHARDQKNLTDATFATIMDNDWADRAADKGLASQTKDQERVREYADYHRT